MRLLVCGSRDWADRAGLYRTLDRIAAVVKIDVVIEGEARGADQMARDWAIGRKIAVMPFPANWGLLGKRAGPERNRRMYLEGKPDLVVAFPIKESRGTWDMVSVARAGGTRAWVMPADESKIDAIGEGVFV